MKKLFCIIMLLLILAGVAIAQEQGDPKKGTVRFDPADIFINLHNALPGISTTWTRYVSPDLGIPVELDVHIGWGVIPGVQISLLSGVEYFPPGFVNKERSGIVLDAKLGISVLIQDEISPAIICKANVGYQFISGRGLVFTPGAGVIYNGHNGFGLNFNLALGFTY